MGERKTPGLIVTVDTEGDNLWARPREVTTHNAASLPRFQALAEKYGLKPTWLVNWEMARDPRCTEFLRDVLARGAGEVGAHLHAWDTPPLESLTEDDIRHHPFLTEYPEPVRRAKLENLIGALEDAFERPIKSHRAGRWALDGRYAQLLKECGIETDCSVCPGVDWRSTKGNPHGGGGPDYRGASTGPYRMDWADITRAAPAGSEQTLLEVPMTTGAEQGGVGCKIKEIFSKRHQWLRPNGQNAAAMRARVEEAVDSGSAHVMFMIHSSELMAGGSPTFGDQTAIERMYADVEALFAQAASRGCTGPTLSEFADAWNHATNQPKTTKAAKSCLNSIA